jgi:hypothetical protein
MEYRKAVRREFLWADLKESLTVVRSVASKVEKSGSLKELQMDGYSVAQKECLMVVNWEWS